MNKPIPEWVFEDQHTNINRAIRELPEVDVQPSLAYYEAAGGDLLHPICKKLNETVAELNDATNEMIALMESLQGDLSGLMDD